MTFVQFVKGNFIRLPEIFKIYTKKVMLKHVSDIK